MSASNENKQVESQYLSLMFFPKILHAYLIASQCSKQHGSVYSSKLINFLLYILLDKSMETCIKRASKNGKRTIIFISTKNILHRLLKMLSSVLTKDFCEHIFSFVHARVNTKISTCIHFFVDIKFLTK